MRTIHCSCYKNTEFTNFPHFASEKFVMIVSMKDRTFLEKFFYKNNDYAQVALQKFQILKSIKKSLMR